MHRKDKIRVLSPIELEMIEQEYIKAARSPGSLSRPVDPEEELRDLIREAAAIYPDAPPRRLITAPK